MSAFLQNIPQHIEVSPNLAAKPIISYFQLFPPVNLTNSHHRANPNSWFSFRYWHTIHFCCLHDPRNHANEGPFAKRMESSQTIASLSGSIKMDKECQRYDFCQSMEDENRFFLLVMKYASEIIFLEMDLIIPIFPLKKGGFIIK
jgi:hypothetical protein